MINILYEPESVRDDYGILVITEGEPCNIPFSFDITYTDQTNQQIKLEINETDIIEYTIKQDVKMLTPVIKKRYTGVKDNVSVLRLDEQDMAKLLGGKTYVMSVKLLNQQQQLTRVLVRILQVRVQEVV